MVKTLKIYPLRNFQIYSTYIIVNYICLTLSRLYYSVSLYRLSSWNAINPSPIYCNWISSLAYTLNVPLSATFSQTPQARISCPSSVMLLQFVTSSKHLGHLALYSDPTSPKDAKILERTLANL